MFDEVIKALGGQRREGQVQMSEAVAQAIASGRHLAVQAGTGTGKSMAYLVPAILHAVETNTTVVVSTATIALQRQLVGRDLPRLAEAMTDVDVTYAILKGRSNYICLNKVGGGGIQEELVPESPGLVSQVRRLYQWAADTDTGDRDDLSEAVSDAAWAQVSVTSRECVGAATCPFGAECFAEKARRAASTVHIVVTNHAMLAIDAFSPSQVLPEHEVVIVDEAHELADRITSVSTAELYPRGMLATCRRAAKFDADAADNLRLAIESWEAAVPEGRWTHPHLDDLQALASQLSTTHLAVHTSQSGADDGEKKLVVAALADLMATAERILDFSDEDVVWSEGSRTFVAPISVAHTLAAHLFSSRTVVLTSATLTVGGTFETMAASWGLARGSYDSLDVGTPFDYKTHGLLYIVPRRVLPAPGTSDTQFELITTMVTAAGGRTLALFSSRRAAEETAAHLKSELPFPVLCQGEDSLSSLVTQFSEQEESVLCGTLSLWQGVDVPGPSLSLVIMDRIPFPRPDDPLIQARTEVDGFLRVSAAHAALLMAQGAGRLLRTVDDRGVVAILDPRLNEKSKGYSTFILDSLPPMWRTRHLHHVVGALERLRQSTTPEPPQ